MKKTFTQLVAASLAMFAIQANAANYQIDVEGAHAFVHFKIKHLGYSWLLGRFNTFDGTFTYDAESPEDSQINLTIQTASVDSNHAERDEHLRAPDFLDVEQYPTATFTSTSFEPQDEDGVAVLSGDFNLHGVTRNINFLVTKIGEGPDPWGGYRVGFEGRTVLALEDYGIKNILGPASANVEIELYIEGIRQ